MNTLNRLCTGSLERHKYYDPAGKKHNNAQHIPLVTRILQGEPGQNQVIILPQ
jgi:hypothetical protein